MRITWDSEADAAYLYLTGNELPPGRRSVECPTPPDAAAMVRLDWQDGRLVGIEVLGAARTLHADLLAAAEHIGGRG